MGTWAAHKRAGVLHPAVHHAHRHGFASMLASSAAAARQRSGLTGQDGGIGKSRQPAALRLELVLRRWVGRWLLRSLIWGMIQYLQRASRALPDHDCESGPGAAFFTSATPLFVGIATAGANRCDPLPTTLPVPLQALGVARPTRLQAPAAREQGPPGSPRRGRRLSHGQAGSTVGSSLDQATM